MPFVEVTLDGWDTHGSNAAAVKNLSQTVDAAWASLMRDLKERGLLETTLIVWMGEFGRTPKFPRPDGRDHWPNSFSAVLAGGGIKGGQVIGDTGPDGASIKDRPVSVPEFLATICRRWASTTRSRTCPTWAGPSALWPRARRRCRKRWDKHYASTASRGFNAASPR